MARKKYYHKNMGSKKEEKLLFKAVLPAVLNVQINKAEEGGYWAKVIEVPCYSQGETFTELFDILTRAIYAYYNVPEKYISEIGRYIPVESVKKIVEEDKPPQRYTLDDILPKRPLSEINQLSLVA